MTWVLVAAGLVVMMQVGFLLLEAGMVRSKNSINAAQKNLLDFVFGVIAFAAVGFMRWIWMPTSSPTIRSMPCTGHPARRDRRVNG